MSSTSHHPLPTSHASALLKQLASILGYMLLFALCLFGGAWTLDWWRGWVFLAVLLGVRLYNLLSVFMVNKSLLAERIRPPIQQGQPLGDRILLTSFMASYSTLVVFCGWDAVRAQLLPPPSDLLSGLGLALFITGWVIITLVFKQNAFATMVIRHQSEREHYVVDSGLYSLVRHPMYAGLVPVMAGMALWLQSTAGLVFVLIPVLILMLRIRYEEGFLRRELAGYADYSLKVRWRLLPGIW